jgi:hypothetical protein
MGLYWFNLENIYMDWCFTLDWSSIGKPRFYNPTYLILFIQNSKIVLVPKDIH